MELMNAVALLNHPRSLEVLISHYQRHPDDFTREPALAHQFAVSVTRLGESRAFEILESLYLDHDDHALRWRVLEALATGGGPDSALALSRLSEREHRKDVRREIDRLLRMLPITT
jgi:hypothetical protein